MEAAVAEEKHAVRVQCEGCSALLEVCLTHLHSLKHRVLYLRGRLPLINTQAVVKTISPFAGGRCKGWYARQEVRAAQSCTHRDRVHNNAYNQLVAETASPVGAPAAPVLGTQDTCPRIVALLDRCSARCRLELLHMQHIPGLFELTHCTS